MQEPETHFQLEGQVGHGLKVDLIERAYETYKDAPVSQSSEKPDQVWKELDVNDELCKDIIRLWTKVIPSRATFGVRSLILGSGAPGFICSR